MLTELRLKEILNALAIAKDDTLMGECWAAGMTVGELRDLTRVAQLPAAEPEESNSIRPDDPPIWFQTRYTTVARPKNMDVLSDLEGEFRK